MDAVILTPITLEYTIVRGFLMNLEIRRYAKFTCEVGQFKGKHHTYQIAIKETGSRETAAALTTQSVIEELNPSLLILLGICGGIKDVKIGDVVVGTKAYGYEAGKETPDGFMARPESYHYDKELIEYIKILLHYSDWKKRSTHSQNARVIFGPVASGNKVITTTTSPIYQQLKRHYNDTTAIEMEAAGFAEAAFRYKNVRILNIRGVSDLLDGKHKSDAGGSQERAVRNAAAFVFEMLWNLEFDEFKLIVMNEKKLADSIQKEVQLIIESPKSYMLPQQQFLDNVQAIDPNAFPNLHIMQKDSDAQAHFRYVLKQKFMNDRTLFKEMKKILQNYKNSTSITDSRNVIENSTISSSRDIHIGDKIVNQKHSGSGDNIGGDKFVLKN